MRGIFSLVTDIRKGVFTEVAKMACPGGCVAGAGTMLPVDQAAKLVSGFQKEARTTSPLESPYHDMGKELEEEE